MGIGYALASGLVKGFTQNIGMRLEERKAEKERLDGLTNAIVAAGLTDDFDNTNVNAIKEYVSKGREALDSTGVDIFGTRTGDIITEEDTMDMIGSLKSTSDKKEYETTIGAFNFVNDLNKFGRGDSFAALNEMSNVFNSTEGRRLLAEANDDDLRTLHGYATRHRFFLDNDYQMAQEAGIAYDIDIGSQFSQFSSFDGMVKSRIGLSPYDGTDPEDDTTGGDVDFGDINSRFVVDFNDEDYGTEYTQVASAFGFKPEQAKKFSEFWSGYTAIGGFNQEKKQDILNASAQIIQSFNKAGTPLSKDTLDSQAPAFFFMTDRTASEVLSILGRELDNDPTAMALALGVFAPVKDFKQRKEGINYFDPESSGRKVAAQLIFGPDATEEQFNDLIKTNDEISTVLGKAPDGSVDGSGLRGLLAQVQNLEGPLGVDKLYGIVAAGKSVMQDFFGMEDGDRWREGANTGSVIAASYADNAPVSRQVAAARADKINPATGKPYSEEDLTDDFLFGLDQSVTAAYQRGLQSAASEKLTGSEATERAKRYAKFEATRIALAFQMARAADPSGRLSNQDIEAQLVRLGQNWDAPEVLEQRIKATIRDFEILQNRYGPMIQAGSATGPVSTYQKKQIKGFYTLMQLAKKAGYETPMQALQQQRVEDMMAPFDPSSMYMYNGIPHSNETLEPVENIDPSTIPSGEGI